VRVTFELDESNGRNDYHAGHVEEPFQHPDAENVRHWMLGTLGQEQRADWFTRPSEQKHRRESGQRGRVNFPEFSAPQVALEHLPAQRAKRVTAVDKDHSGSQPEWIGAPDGSPKFSGAEFRKTKRAAGPINQVPGNYNENGQEHPSFGPGSHAD
jgi:hypothetical protein